jgi:hypothetical protein
MLRAPLAALLVAAVAGPAVAQPAAGDDAVDVSAYRDRLKLLGDGKGHYVALLPFTISDGPDTGYLFYGDGKTFWAQRRRGGGRSGNESFDTTFWEPRVTRAYQAGLSYRDQKYVVQCDERKTELTPVPKDEAQKILADARFLATKWKRRAYALARDNAGIYYYVDRAREPQGNKDFRVFRGPKGAVKPQKMVNVVSDTEGDIFITQAGKLRLVLSKNEHAWLHGGKTVKLTPVPVEDNAYMIYSELGVYAGERLGTPCDDL